MMLIPQKKHFMFCLVLAGCSGGNTGSTTKSHRTTSSTGAAKAEANKPVSTSTDSQKDGPAAGTGSNKANCSTFGLGGTAVSYQDDIRPIVNASCLQCHRSGQTAPNLSNSTNAVLAGYDIVAAVDDKRMPPSGGLSASSIALFNAWRDGGYQEAKVTSSGASSSGSATTASSTCLE